MRGVRPESKGVVIDLWVQPNAKKSEFDGFYGESLKLKLNAPPVDGKANKECLRFMAGILFINRSSLEIISGQGSRHKIVRVAGLDYATVCQRIEEILR